MKACDGAVRLSLSRKSQTAMAKHNVRSVFIHPLALCEAVVGSGTRVWAFTHVMAGAKVGTDCNIGGHAFIEDGAVIGNRVTVKNGVMIWQDITIADDVIIGPGAIFTNDRFPRSPRGVATRARYCDSSWREKTLVEHGASIGAGAVICPGITIGAYAMVAAGAVVTRDVAPHRLVAGAPARAIGWVDETGRRIRGRPKAMKARR